jgi:phage shock protein A
MSASAALDRVRTTLAQDATPIARLEECLRELQTVTAELERRIDAARAEERMAEFTRNFN